MRCRALAYVPLALVCWAFAAIGSLPAFAASRTCLQAADIAERELALPNGLLRSIGQVETGNRPWSVDRDGSGVSFASADDAISYVEQEATSARYVDVGCFQIDLAYHPDAFRSLAEAFDPVANAMAAGRYLLSLRRGTSSWPEAVGRYHSGQPDPGRAYAARVYASLLAGPSDRWMEESERLIAGIRIVVPTAYEMAPGGRAVLPQARGLPVVQTP